MKSSSWLGADARKTFADAVRAIEARSSAEIVVTVRDRSAPYKHVQIAWGSFWAAAMLLFYVYYPITFADDLAVPSVVIAFAAGLLLGSVDALKRPFLSKHERRQAVALAARAAFYDANVGVTKRRTGVLVYVSLLERAVEVVPDTGVRVDAMGKAWTDAVAALQTDAERGASPVELAKTLDRLGDALAGAMPVTDDDVNELPDEVIA